MSSSSRVAAARRESEVVTTRRRADLSVSLSVARPVFACCDHFPSFFLFFPPSRPQCGPFFRTLVAMTDNIYSKGTRVWLTDKEQGWISAEVVQVTKGENDAIKLIFLDERGKVSIEL